MEKRKKSLLLIIYFISLIFLIYGKAISGDLIVKSSAVFTQTGRVESSGVAVDSNDNIFITGNLLDTDDIFTVKYNSDFIFISSKTFDSGHYDRGFCIAVDSNDNIFVAGRGGSSALILKYNNDLVVVSSKTFAQGIDSEFICIAIDDADNIIAAGVSNDTSDDYITIKCDNDLVLYSSATYNGGANDFISGIATDSELNVIVTGKSAGPQDVSLTIKYDKYLNVISSATYSTTYNMDLSQNIAVDLEGNIFVAGQQNNNLFTLKYDKNLKPVSSHLIYAEGADYLSGIAKDENGNIFVTGRYFNDSLNFDYLTIKYDNDLNIVSSGTFDLKQDESTGIVIDSHGDIVVTGLSTNGSDKDIITIKYYGAPVLDFLSLTSVKAGEIIDINIKGKGFLDGANVSFSGEGIIVDSVTVHNDTLMLASITIAENTDLGFYDVMITNPDGQDHKKESFFKVIGQSIVETEINKSTKTTITLNSETGIVTLDIAETTFLFDTKIYLEKITPPKLQGEIFKETDIGIGISVLSGEQPLKPITLKIYYRDSDIAGFDETKLVVCRYDPQNLRWIELSSVVNTKENYITAKIDHLSIFGVVERNAATSLDSALIYPNPYYSSIHNNITFDNLTNDTVIKIYTITGKLVKELTETNSDGKLVWDGKNESGYNLASGVYIAYIKNGSKAKTMKFAIVR